MTSTTRGRCGWKDSDKSTRSHEHQVDKLSVPCLTKLHAPQWQTIMRDRIGTRSRRRWPHTTKPSSPPLNFHRVWKLSCPPVPIAAPRSRRTMLSSRRARPRRTGNFSTCCTLAQLTFAEFADPPLELLAGRAATSNGRLGTVTQAGLRGGEKRLVRANPDPFVFSENENGKCPTKHSRQPMLLSLFLAVLRVLHSLSLSLSPCLSESPKQSLALLRARCKRTFLCLAFCLQRERKPGFCPPRSHAHTLTHSHTHKHTLGPLPPIPPPLTVHTHTHTHTHTHMQIHIHTYM